MASLCPQWAPPSHNGPIQSPTKSDCPKFNGLCWERTGHKRRCFQVQCTLYFHSAEKEQKRCPCTSGRAEARLCHPPTPQNHPHESTTIFWCGMKIGSLCQCGSWLFLPSTQDICIKMWFFCPLRRAKRKLGVGGVGWGVEGKGRKRPPNQAQEVSGQTLNYPLERFLEKQPTPFFALNLYNCC